MADLSDSDPSVARFRRGGAAGATSAEPGPPPVVPAYAGQADPSGLSGDGSDPGLLQYGPPENAAPAAWNPPPAAPTNPLYGEFAETLTPPTEPASREALYETPSYEWMPVESDPGRPSGIVSIAVGVFVGIVGLFIGVHSVRKSRQVGLTGTIGIIGVIVSCLSLLLFGGIILSWVRYEVELAQQCSLVGPGQYYTASGDVVTCN